MRAWSRRERVLLVIIAVLFVGMSHYRTLAKDALYSSNDSLRGTYQREGCYLVFDGNGSFCRYTPEEGILDSGGVWLYGSYGDTDFTQYALTADSGRRYCVVRTMDGLYLFDGAENRVLPYTKKGNYLARIGDLD